MSTKPRAERVTVRFTPVQLRKIDVAAKKSGLTRSEFIRRSIGIVRRP